MVPEIKSLNKNPVHLDWLRAGGLGFRVQGLGIRVEGLLIRVTPT